MQSPNVFALRDSNLNSFLYSDIGLEPSGLMLRVVSLFARKGDDPWHEAARLAGLTVPAAVASLAHQIAEMPDSRWQLPAATAIATRLVALLPKKVAGTVVSGVRNFGGLTTWLAIGLVLIVALTLSRLL